MFFFSPVKISAIIQLVHHAFTITGRYKMLLHLFDVEPSFVPLFDCSMIHMTMKEGRQGAETGTGRRAGTGIEREIVRRRKTETKRGTTKGIGTGTMITITETTETGKEEIEGNGIAVVMMILTITVAEIVIGKDTTI